MRPKIPDTKFNKIKAYLKKYHQSYVGIFDLAAIGGLTTDKARLYINELMEQDLVDSVLVKIPTRRAFLAYQWIGE